MLINGKMIVLVILYIENSNESIYPLAQCFHNTYIYTRILRTIQKLDYVSDSIQNSYEKQGAI